MIISKAYAYIHRNESLIRIDVIMTLGHYEWIDIEIIMAWGFFHTDCYDIDIDMTWKAPRWWVPVLILTHVTLGPKSIGTWYSAWYWTRGFVSGTWMMCWVCVFMNIYISSYILSTYISRHIWYMHKIYWRVGYMDIVPYYDEALWLVLET